jgi:hypothetical protein
LVAAVLCAGIACSHRAARRADGGADAGTDAGADRATAPDLDDGAADGEAGEAPADGPDGAIASSSVGVTPSGDIVVAGTLTGTVTLGSEVLTEAGGGDLLLAAFDPAGAPRWSRRWGDAQGQAQGLTALALGRAGTIALAADFRGSVDLGGGPLTSAGATDVVVATLDAAGGHVWSRRFGGAGSELPAGVAVDSSGRVAAAARSSGPFSFSDPQPGSDGAAASSSAVAVLAAGGDVAWSKSWAHVLVTGIAFDANDGLIVAGSFTDVVNLGGADLTSAGGTDIFVASFSSAGDHRWSKSFGGTGSDIASALAVSTGGDILLTGSFSDTLDFGGPPLTSVLGNDRTVTSADLFVVRLDAAGGHVWSQRYGDSGHDQRGSAIDVDGAGNVLVAGAFQGALDFGRGALAATGAAAFVVKLDGTGSALWNQQMEMSAATVRAAGSSAVLVGGAFAAGAAFPSALATLAAGRSVFLVEYAP